MFDLRPATQDDDDALREMAARFGGAGAESAALDGWMLEGWDRGLIAEHDGRLAGACWWRPYRGFTAGGRDRAEREIFLAVTPAFEGQGLASRLLDETLEAARRDPEVTLLAARPRHDVGIRMLERRGFEERRAPYPGVDAVWVLHVGG